jgi:hypothetical protein
VVPVALGFSYAAYLVAVAFGGLALGYRLWPLEYAVAAAVGYGVFLLAARVEEKHESGLRPDLAQRAIERLAYRRGNVVTVESVARETLLDEPGALHALERMVSAGAAERHGDGEYRILAARWAPLGGTRERHPRPD